MRELIVRGVRIDDTFAEAFTMRATAVVITADSARWARQAAVTMTGFGTSVIGCGCEAGIDTELDRRETPDRRPGVRALLFAVSTSELQKQLQNRVGQCVLTTPGAACYAGLAGEEALKLGNALRFFGGGPLSIAEFGAVASTTAPVPTMSSPLSPWIVDCSRLRIGSSARRSAAASSLSVTTRVTVNAPGAL